MKQNTITLVATSRNAANCATRRDIWPADMICCDEAGINGACGGVIGLKSQCTLSNDRSEPERAGAGRARPVRTAIVFTRRAYGGNYRAMMDVRLRWPASNQHCCQPIILLIQVFGFCEIICEVIDYGVAVMCTKDSGQLAVYSDLREDYATILYYYYKPVLSCRRRRNILV